MSNSIRWGSVRPSKADSHWLESPSSARPAASQDRNALGHSVDSAEFAEMAYRSELSRDNSRDTTPPKSRSVIRDKGYTSLPAAGRPTTAPRHRLDELGPGTDSESLSALSLGRVAAGANGERKVFLVAVQVISCNIIDCWSIYSWSFLYLIAGV
jgi:hypothetical protein